MSITREVVIAARPASCPVHDPLNMGARVTFPFCALAEELNQPVVEPVTLDGEELTLDGESITFTQTMKGE